MAEPIVPLKKDGAYRYTYPLRDGVHLEIEILVALRVDVTKHPDGEAAIQGDDKKSAEYTYQYLDAHIKKAFESFNQSRGNGFPDTEQMGQPEDQEWLTK